MNRQHSLEFKVWNRNSPTLVLSSFVFALFLGFVLIKVEELSMGVLGIGLCGAGIVLLSIVDLLQRRYEFSPSEARERVLFLWRQIALPAGWKAVRGASSQVEILDNAGQVFRCFPYLRDRDGDLISELNALSSSLDRTTTLVGVDQAGPDRPQGMNAPLRYAAWRLNRLVLASGVALGGAFLFFGFSYWDTLEVGGRWIAGTVTGALIIAMVDLAQRAYEIDHRRIRTRVLFLWRDTPLPPQYRAVRDRESRIRIVDQQGNHVMSLGYLRDRTGSITADIHSLASAAWGGLSSPEGNSKNP